MPIPHRQTPSLHVSNYNLNVSFEIFPTGEEQLTSSIPVLLGSSDGLHQKCLYSVKDGDNCRGDHAMQSRCHSSFTLKIPCWVWVKHLFLTELQDRQILTTSCLCYNLPLHTDWQEQCYRSQVPPALRETREDGWRKWKEGSGYSEISF